MKRVGLFAVLAMTAWSSYAGAAPPKGLLGAPMRKVDGAVSTPPPTVNVRVGGGLSPARSAQALSALAPETRSVTRGAADAKVYREASPAVVLVVSKEGTGSGGLLTADGKIVTNLHVVGDDEVVGVIFKPKVEGDKFSEADIRPAKVIRRDAVADLALLQVSVVPEGVTPLALGDIDAVEVGADVHAIGHPQGNTWTYTRGIVSQVRRDYEWRAEDRKQHKATVIQTQTPINPGNSGGPLLDDQLRVVGINSFGAEGEGLNYAVSATEVKALLAAKADRAAPKPPVCKATAVSEDVAKEDPAGTYWGIDEDCDKVADYLLFLPDDKKEAVLILADNNGDGKVDTTLVDEDRDDHFETAFYDTDGNGKYDMVGDIRKDETEPYRLEKISEEDEPAAPAK